MEAFVFKPTPEVGAQLQKYFESFEEDFFQPHQLTERQELSVKREINIHAALLQNFVVTDPDVPVTKLNTFQLAVSSRAREGTRGRTKQYRSSRHNMTFRRALRNWLMNKFMSSAMGLDFIEPMPDEPDLEYGDLHYVPIESLEMIMRFELWTKYQVPHRAYIIYTREDRQVLANYFGNTHHREPSVLPNAETDEDGKAKCLRFEDYLEMRKDPQTRALIEKALVEYYFPTPHVAPSAECQEQQAA